MKFRPAPGAHVLLFFFSEIKREGSVLYEGEELTGSKMFVSWSLKRGTGKMTCWIGRRGSGVNILAKILCRRFKISLWLFVSLCRIFTQAI